jgi:hypothetical protein
MFTIQGQGCWCKLQVARAGHKWQGKGARGRGTIQVACRVDIAQVADAGCKWQLGAGCKWQGQDVSGSLVRGASGSLVRGASGRRAWCKCLGAKGSGNGRGPEALAIIGVAEAVAMAGG